MAAKLSRLLLSAAAALCLAGCATQWPAVGHEIIDCCTSDTSSYRNFRLEVGPVPAFLAPFAESSLADALTAKGLKRGEPADLLVKLSFDQLSLDEAIHADDFEGHLEPGGSARFIARLTFDASDSKTGKRVWLGRISRLHNVDPGEYMHAGRAAGALRGGFDNALAGFGQPLP